MDTKPKNTMEEASIRVTAIKFAMDTLISSGNAFTYEEVLKIAQKYEQFIMTGK